MEPISIALTAYSAIKAGVAAGKEIQSLASDIGQLWDAIDKVKDNHNKKRNSPVTQVKGVNQEALETFVALQKAKDLENELREMIIWTRGIDAWQELLRLRADIKKQRQDEEKRARMQAKKKKQQMLEIMVACLATIFGIGLIIGFIMFLKASKA